MEAALVKSAAVIEGAAAGRGAAVVAVAICGGTSLDVSGSFTAWNSFCQALKVGLPTRSYFSSILRQYLVLDGIDNTYSRASKACSAPDKLFLDDTRRGDQLTQKKTA